MDNPNPTTREAVYEITREARLELHSYTHLADLVDVVRELCRAVEILTDEITGQHDA